MKSLKPYFALFLLTLSGCDQHDQTFDVGTESYYKNVPDSVVHLVDLDIYTHPVEKVERYVDLVTSYSFSATSRHTNDEIIDAFVGASELELGASSVWPDGKHEVNLHSSERTAVLFITTADGVNNLMVTVYDEA